MKLYILYLDPNVSNDKAVRQFKSDGKVSGIYFDAVAVYTLDYFEMLFNSEEILATGLIKFADETLANYYK